MSPSAWNLTELQRGHEFHVPDEPEAADVVALIAVLCTWVYFGVFCVMLWRKRHLEHYFKSYVLNLLGLSGAGSAHLLGVFVSNDHLAWSRALHTHLFCAFWEFWLQYLAVATVVALLMQRLYLFMVAIVDDHVLQTTPLYAMRTTRRNRLFAAMFLGPVIVLCLLVSATGGSRRVEDTETGVMLTCYNEPGWKIVYTVWGSAQWLTVLGLLIYAYGSGQARGFYRQHVDERGKAAGVVGAALVMLLVNVILSMTNALLHVAGRVTFTLLLCVFYVFSFTLLAGKVLYRNYEQLTRRDERRIRAVAKAPPPQCPWNFQDMTYNHQHMEAFLRYCRERDEVEMRIARQQSLQTEHLVYCHQHAPALYTGALLVDRRLQQQSDRRAERFQGRTPRPVEVLDEQEDDSPDQRQTLQTHLAECLQRETREIRHELERRQQAHEPSTARLLELYETVRRWRSFYGARSEYVTPERMRDALREVIECLCRVETSVLPATDELGQELEEQRETIIDVSTGYLNRLREYQSQCATYEMPVCNPIRHQVIQMLGQRYFVSYVTGDCAGAVIEVGEMKRRHEERIQRLLDNQALRYTEGLSDTEVGADWTTDAQSDWVVLEEDHGPLNLNLNLDLDRPQEPNAQKALEEE